MDEQQALEIVTRMVARGRGVDARALTPQTDLKEDLGFDSLDASELFASLHGELGTGVDLPDLTELRTIEDIARCIAKQEG